MPTMMFNAAAVLPFFSGVNLERLLPQLAVLEHALSNGAWNRKGEARSLLAALGKANVAQREWKKAGAEKVERLSFEKYRYDHDVPLCRAISAIESAVRYGSVRALLRCDVASFDGAEWIPEAFRSFARAYVGAMRPIVEAIEHLNATAIKPVITSIGASPTITATLADLGATSVAPCPSEIFKVPNPLAGKEGEPAEIWLFVRLLWPTGTKHGTSRFCKGDQCHSCGHAIRNPRNWVPLVLTTPSGPRSLWVGRDCAKTLFGVEIKKDGAQ